MARGQRLPREQLANPKRRLSSYEHRMTEVPDVKVATPTGRSRSWPSEDDACCDVVVTPNRSPSDQPDPAHETPGQNVVTPNRSPSYPSVPSAGTGSMCC